MIIMVISFFIFKNFSFSILFLFFSVFFFLLFYFILFYIWKLSLENFLSQPFQEEFLFEVVEIDFVVFVVFVFVVFVVFVFVIGVVVDVFEIVIGVEREEAHVALVEKIELEQYLRKKV